MKFVKYHNVVVPSAVKDSFEALAEKVYTNIGFVIEPMDGFKTKEQVIQELRGRIKNPDKLKVNEDEYVEILAATSPLSFEPPLIGNTTALRDLNGQEEVFTIPNKIPGDPRLSGRIVQIGPKNLINPTLLYFLVQNAGSYGFLHYGPKDPSIWYWRGDKTPHTYTPQETVSTFTNELSYLL